MIFSVTQQHFTNTWQLLFLKAQLILVIFGDCRGHVRIRCAFVQLTNPPAVTREACSPMYSDNYTRMGFAFVRFFRGCRDHRKAFFKAASRTKALCDSDLGVNGVCVLIERKKCLKLNSIQQILWSIGPRGNCAVPQGLQALGNGTRRTFWLAVVVLELKTSGPALALSPNVTLQGVSDSGETENCFSFVWGEESKFSKFLTCQVLPWLR